MAEGVGFRVVQTIKKLDPKLVQQFAPYGVANIGDAMGRFNIMEHHIKSVNLPGVKLVGSAVTVRLRPGDNLMLHKALDMAMPGDVLVVDVQGSTRNGLWGALMTETAMAKGVAGLVMDGGIRDAAEIRALGFPVFTRAVIAAGGDKDGPGEVNTPISCGGVPVFPGDIVVGDEDGIAIVPREQAAGILKKVADIVVNEQKKHKSIADGTLDKSWIDKALTQKGCVFEP